MSKKKKMKVMDEDPYESEDGSVKEVPIEYWLDWE